MAEATLTLTAFLLARIAEDEERAENAIGDRPPGASMTGAFAGEYGPVRVLAECAAKRGAIEAAWADHGQIESEWGTGKSREQLAAEDDNPRVIEWLALPYADHPDYREEWA